ncbi:MAG: gamma-glutamyltransferase [Acidobacteria bacterium]|nr:MAG: gamma-glutamyltransferase [Acidobacteriota bacterium]
MSHGDRPASNVQGSRSPVLAMNGLVATSQPLASAAALRVLQDGGNAVDAAISAAAVLNVVEPMSTGIGGDMFALVYMQQDAKPVGLNGSGWAGSKASVDFFKSRNMTEVPLFGMHSVTVPGAVAGWYKLHQRYGKLPMSRVLAAAIDYADRGFPVSDIIASQWQRSEAKLRATPEAARDLLLDGRAPRPGDLVRLPRLARTLRQIAEGGRDVFYKGEIANKIVEFSGKHDGMFTLADFADFDAQWIEPVSTNYRGYDVYELAAQTQGITALEMLNMLEGFDLQSLGHNSTEHLHLMIEAKKLAFADRDAYIADPDKVRVPVGRLISKEYASERRKLISTSHAIPNPRPGLRENGDTVYLTVVDKDRNAVSFINSLFESFGSGLVVGDTGIVLHDRGALFDLQPTHPNVVAPRKRPFHTLIPAMVLNNNKPFFSFGVMGGDNQPQGHVQVLINLIDFGMDAQEAGEAPRFRHSGEEVLLESAFSPSVRSGLARIGHHVTSAIEAWGGYQGIIIDPRTGALMGGSDPRKDGLAIGW